MVDINASFQGILTEIIRLQHPSTLALETPYFPGLIPAGPDGSIAINDKIEKEIRKVADWMLAQHPKEKARYTLNEWRTFVRNAFGPAIMQLDIDVDVVANARKLKELVETAIDTPIKIVPLKLTSMGCTLFDKPLDKAFEIGPVRFEPKADWLERAEKVGQISNVVRTRLERALGGHPCADASDNKQAMIEQSILDVLQPAQLVCTVETHNLAPEMAETRAIIGARLAQMAIALLWPNPSRALEGFHLSVDHGHRRIKTVLFIPGQNWISGSRIKGLPFGPYMPSAEWITLENQARSLFDLAGKMIACWTNADAYEKAAPPLRNLAQALFFMWEGCRDENDLMSIVKFTAALEAMAQGKSSAIEKLAKARLRLKAGAKIAGERDIKQAVDWIYSKGRSRTLHGNNPDILHDWSDARAVAESLTRHCFVGCMDWLEQNPTATDSKAFQT